MTPRLPIFAPAPIRIVGTVLEAVRWTLTHPSGRTVTLVGMVHVGDDTYYAHTSRVIAALAAEGAEVQYELITKASEDVVASLSEGERSELLQMRDLFKRSATSVLAEMLGLSLQKSRLTFPDDARNVDVTDLHLLRRLGLPHLEKMFATEELEKLTPESMRRIMRFVMGNFRVVSTIGKVFPRARLTSQVILHERNEVALVAARERLEQGDLVLVWGAAHLPGILAELESDGYALKGESWARVADFA